MAETKSRSAQKSTKKLSPFPPSLESRRPISTPVISVLLDPVKFLIITRFACGTSCDKLSLKQRLGEDKGKYSRQLNFKGDLAPYNVTSD